MTQSTNQDAMHTSEADDASTIGAQTELPFLSPREQLQKKWPRPRIIAAVRLAALCLLFAFTVLTFVEYPSDAFTVPAGWALGISMLTHIIRPHHGRRFADIIPAILAPAGTIMAGVIVGSFIA